MKRVLGDGNMPCDLFLLGERPGIEEHHQGRGFVGPAGEELWARIWKVLRLTREAFFVSNLVKTFSMEPPSADEIARDAKTLRTELLSVRPKIIITIGYHAARALLPQFAGVTGDYFHGLAHEFTYGALKPRTAIVVPVCHSSAALRQPDRYQVQLTSDLRAVKEVIEGTRSVHVTRRPVPYRVGLAGFGKAGLTLGLDTEGAPSAPECVTLAQSERAVACVETVDGKRPQFLKPSIEHAKRLAIHHSKGDIAVLRTLGIDHLPRVDDTMLQAYLLGLPQGLKVLTYRECGFEMSDYSDLVDPLDEQLVRKTLTDRHDIWMQMHARSVRWAEKKAERRAKLLQVRKTKKMVASILKRRLAHTPQLPPLRVIKGVARMLAKTDAAPDDSAD